MSESPGFWDSVIARAQDITVVHVCTPECTHAPDFSDQAASDE